MRKKRKKDGGKQIHTLIKYNMIYLNSLLLHISVYCLPCIMLLLWVAVEDFWPRPRPAGFVGEAAAPEWTDEGFLV